MEVTPKGRMWFLAGVSVCDSSSKEYANAFGGMRFDEKMVHHHLQQCATKADVERGTLQSTIGVSTRNYEHSPKTNEELSQ
eukprot:scaffold23134_cov96-Amphora_coffeaeformis.AAC.1